MQVSAPHFVLYSETTSEQGQSRWKFVLQSVGSEDSFTAADQEPVSCGNRLELLAVVRGLEALDGPSRVTLVTRSRYVARGIRRGLAQWRERGWHWERFGNLVPIRDRDLWQRVDRALRFHQVETVVWQFDEAPKLSAFGAAVPTPEAAGPEAAFTEPALLIVPRRAGRSIDDVRRDSALHRALNGLRDGVLAPLSAFMRPAFTRAA
jgi:ribonuclease HI